MTPSSYWMGSRSSDIPYIYSDCGACSFPESRRNLSDSFRIGLDESDIGDEPVRSCDDFRPLVEQQGGDVRSGASLAMSAEAAAFTA